MKRLRGRTLITLLLAAGLAVGVVSFCVCLVRDGSSWVGFFGTTYYSSGVIYDSEGTKLYDGGTGEYADSRATRVATLHLVGNRNFGSSLRSVLSSRLTGYSLVTGTTLGSHDVSLTVDAALNETAYAALNGHKGTVAVYDYTTGDVKCLVSSPSFDPNAPPSDLETDPAYEGAYMNRFFSATYPPGSTFKLVTTAAALERKADIDQFRYTCTGSLAVEGQEITCPYAHGTDMDLAQCLATSCNGAYATLALELGGDTLRAYMEEAGLLSSRTVCDLRTAKGSFTVAPDGSALLGWSGVGQYEDLVNPCGMLGLVGGIANRGVAVVPKLVDRETISGSQVPAAFPDRTDTYPVFREETCEKLKELMRNNVTTQYGQQQFGDLAVCAKSGTAEVGGGKQPHAWFVGFLDDTEHPLAFVVVVENGGGGARVAGAIAAKVLLQATAG